MSDKPTTLQGQIQTVNDAARELCDAIRAAALRDAQRLSHLISAIGRKART